MQDSGASWSTIALVLLVVIGAIMAVFMGYIVRTAYELKIDMKARFDKNLRLIDEESNKKARGLRQELGADIERARAALFEDARRKLGEATVEMGKRESEFQAAVRQERVQLTVALDSLRDEVAALHSRMDELERELLTGGDMGQDSANKDSLGPVKPTASVISR